MRYLTYDVMIQSITDGRGGGGVGGEARLPGGVASPLSPFVDETLITPRNLLSFGTQKQCNSQCTQWISNLSAECKG